MERRKFKERCNNDTKLDYDYGDIQVKYYENKVTEKFKKGE